MEGLQYNTTKEKNKRVNIKDSHKKEVLLLRVISSKQPSKTKYLYYIYKTQPSYARTTFDLSK